MTDKFAFFAYPARPKEVGQSAKAAIKTYNERSGTTTIEGWEANDISGKPLTEPIFQKIQRAQFLAADITSLNPNVTFEIGYTIGLKKRCFLVRNSALQSDAELAAKVGIYDTLGYEEYENSEELTEILLRHDSYEPIKIDPSLNRQQPVYVVETPRKNDAMLAISSRVKKARLRYRSFDPSEDVRLSAVDAIRHVEQSAGVITPLLKPSEEGHEEHNLRAMFVAGISTALDLPTLILCSKELEVPIDVRDMVRPYTHPEDIKDAIHQLSLDVTEYLQGNTGSVKYDRTLLSSLAIGETAAENEMTTLSEYYLDTDQFYRASRGEANLVVGRKGSGKTALFIRLRDTKRANKRNVVIDLLPQGYQLIKLKELVLDYLNVGAKQHLITAFWEYILLLEVAYKLLEKDKKVHLRDHRLTDKYNRLAEYYGVSEIAAEGDFSERLAKISDSIVSRFRDEFESSESDAKVNLTNDEVTSILHKHDIRKLSECVAAYLLQKNEVWLLFDNIDKGWSTDGVTEGDIFLLRCLIDASRKLERTLKQKNVNFHSVVFVRDDVYTLLMKESADYGKDMRVSLDWSDREILGSVLRKRIAQSISTFGQELTQDPWVQVCVSHMGGEPTIERMVDRSLMRPRNLLKIFRHCLGYANNEARARIEADDIIRGLRVYSQDLVIEVDRELTDVFPSARGLIYEFVQETIEYSEVDLLTLLQMGELSESNAIKAKDFLVYYGVLGIKKNEDEPIYIYDVNYDPEMIKVSIRKWAGQTSYVLNPALWPALRLSDSIGPTLF